MFFLFFDLGSAASVVDLSDESMDGKYEKKKKKKKERKREDSVPDFLSTDPPFAFSPQLMITRD
jgi:hypothetical protein